MMSQLRRHLEKGGYLDTVRRMESSDGYRLAAGFEEEQVRCVAGYRVLEALAYGKVLYGDDLVTDGAVRSRDFVESMLGWLAEEVQRNGCARLHLDSGVQRHDEHRFYFREDMNISSYHFAKGL